MAPAILDEVPSAANAVAHGLDDVVAGQDHLKDTGNEPETFPGEPDKENAIGRHDNGLGGSLPAVSATEDDPFDSDSDSGGDDDEFMPRGKGNATLETKKGPQFTLKKVPDTPPSSTTTEKENPGAPGLGEAQKPKDAKK